MPDNKPPMGSKGAATTADRSALVAVVFVLLILAAFVGGIGYVALHFIIKFW